MTIHLSRRAFVLYFMLFCACFNDIIRIPGTSISLFRIMSLFIPIAIYRSAPKVRNYMFAYFIMMVIACLQVTFFYLTYQKEYTFSLSNFLQYAYYYYCIFAVLMVIESLMINTDSKSSIMNFFIFVSVINFIILFVQGISNNGGVSGFSNANNYGTSIAFIASYFLYKIMMGNKKVLNLLLLIAIIWVLILNDCKLSLLGIIAQIVLYIVFADKKNSKTLSTNIIKTISVLIVILFVLYVVRNGFVINEYDVESDLRYVFRGIWSNEVDSSMGIYGAFRLNIILKCLDWIVRTKCLGIGLGNAGMVIRKEFTFVNSRLANADRISLHSFPVEFLLEFGLVAVVCYIILGKYLLKILRSRKLEDAQIVFAVTIISGFILFFQPSEMILQYYSIAFIWYLYLLGKFESTNVERDRGDVNEGEK